MSKRLHEHHIERREDDTFGFTIWHMSRKSETGVVIDASQDGFENRSAAMIAMHNIAHANDWALRAN